MKNRIGCPLLVASLALCMASLPGCVGTAKQSARVRPPAGTPAPAQFAAASLSKSLDNLPVSGDIATFQELAWIPQPAVDVLIEEVQASYDAGQEAYHAGDLDTARKDFNAALDHLMQSHLEATGDERMKQLFNQITDTMQSYEMETEQKDEAAAESDQSGASDDEDSDQQAQAESSAPIEEIANMESLPATDPRLAAMAEKELLTVPHDLPLTINATVLQYLSFFETPRGREIVELGLQRAGRYRQMIENILKQEGLPQDLIYLAQAESAFKPRAISSMKAHGLWQFMPYTGEEYGLHRNYWVDDRDDPVASTRAAAEHLRDLYEMFGDWYLVMAAYNSGPLNVARAVERTGYADFWQLQKHDALPRQTKNYVPIILALTMIAKDPALYGIHVDPDPALQYDTLKLDHAISLHLVADATGDTLDDLEMLNPELTHGVTPNKPGFELRVPPGTGTDLQKQLAAIPADRWTSWRLAKVEPDDSLENIARRFHVTLASLRKVNELDSHDPVASGTTLIVPSAPPHLHRVYYRVRRGDTLESIASHFSVSTSEIRRWNHLRSERAPIGRTLRIYESSYAYEPPRRASTVGRRPATHERTSAKVENTSRRERIEHRVQPGETLWSIAREYSTTIEALKRANPFLAERGLEAGDSLIILPQE
jgi:peptidoglycan lytic transglycosylase D